MTYVYIVSVMWEGDGMEILAIFKDRIEACKYVEGNKDKKLHMDITEFDVY